MKLKMNGEGAGAAKEVLRRFCGSLTDLVSGKRNLCTKIYDEIT